MCGLWYGHSFDCDGHLLIPTLDTMCSGKAPDGNPNDHFFRWAYRRCSRKAPQPRPNLVHAECFGNVLKAVSLLILPKVFDTHGKFYTSFHPLRNFLMIEFSSAYYFVSDE